MCRLCNPSALLKTAMSSDWMSWAKMSVQAPNPRPCPPLQRPLHFLMPPTTPWSKPISVLQPAAGYAPPTMQAGFTKISQCCLNHKVECTAASAYLSCINIPGDVYNQTWHSIHILVGLKFVHVQVLKISCQPCRVWQVRAWQGSHRCRPLQPRLLRSGPTPSPVLGLGSMLAECR